MTDSIRRAFLRAALPLVALVAMAGSLPGQCPNGSPGCAGRGAARPPAPLDSNRVAVTPFRVTTADSLLGEGFAELLAGEFTGEGSPRAVDMATTISAWRHAGGGLRTPLTRDAARQLARNLGAGLLCEGSIIGIGTRVTITASLLASKDGTPRGQPTRITGSVDSIDVLLLQVATSLLGSSESATRAQGAARATRSPAALRAFFEGMSLWRRSRWPEAAVALQRSVAEDSSFALAVYQRWLLLQAASLPLPQGFPRVQSVRDRLGPRERTVIDATLGTGAPRSPARHMDDLRAAAERLGDSPEAWYQYADFVFHNGLTAVPGDSVLSISARAFARAVSLDSQPVYSAHLLQAALQQRDAPTIRQIVRTFEALPDEWPRRWLGAAFLGDQALLERARRAKPTTADTSGLNVGDLFLQAVSLPLPLPLIDEQVRRLAEVVPPTVRAELTRAHWIVYRARGRPAAADRLATGTEKELFRPLFGFWPLAAVTGDAQYDAALLKSNPALSTELPAQAARRACVDTLVHLAQETRGGRAGAPAGPAASTRCGRIIQIWRATLAGPLPDSLVGTLDSLVQLSRANNFTGYENRLLARVHEARGDYKAALAAIRMYPRDFPGSWSATTARAEGRFAVLAADTAGAIRAYRKYLELYADAEPLFAAQRDSVRASLAVLEKRRP